ncbi:MAG: hypothetical protein HQK53_07950 [Oligoflexia bacterium]|nr:hypothetical protein [Oligoflexia bacterium]
MKKKKRLLTLSAILALSCFTSTVLASSENTPEAVVTVLLRRDVEEHLARAKDAALQGDLIAMRVDIGYSERRAKEIHLDIKEQVDEIRALIGNPNELLKIEIEKHLVSARDAALQGDLMAMRVDIGYSERRAKEIHLDIKEQVDQIRALIGDPNELLKIEIEKHLASARAAALHKNLLAMRVDITYAEHRAKEINLDIQERVGEIRALIGNQNELLKIEVERHLASARESALRGELIAMRLDLRCAERRAKEINFDIANDIREINDLLQNI